MDSKGKRNGLDDSEKNAMKDYLKEKNSNNEGEGVVLAAISKLPEPDRSLAREIHSIIKKNFPNLTYKTWYGYPAYMKGKELICYFQYASKFKSKYSMLGFSDRANLVDGNMWPVVYAVTKITPSEEVKIIALIKQAVS